MVGRLAHRALHLLVAGVADQHDRVALGGELLRLDVHLGHERAGGVDRLELARAGVGVHARARRRGRRRRRSRPRAPRSPARRRSRRARAAARPRACCARSPCARRPAARTARGRAPRSGRRGRRPRSSRGGRRAAACRASKASPQSLGSSSIMVSPTASRLRLEIRERSSQVRWKQGKSKSIRSIDGHALADERHVVVEDRCPGCRAGRRAPTPAALRRRPQLAPERESEAPSRGMRRPFSPTKSSRIIASASR